MLFTHVCLGTDDLAEARAFYDPVMAALGVTPARQDERRIFYASDGQMLVITLPLDGGRATAANGGTVGFTASSVEMVDAFHAAGLANGGSEEGAPGLRPNGRYGAYLRDPAGNKLCAFAPQS
jgi:catechol 2,3-dioxygenase-like lactoylglutathione lyase family enzyme